MAIDNVRLPVDVEQGAVGGPRFKVEVQTSVSGKEQRINFWDVGRGEWDIAYGIRSMADLASVIALYRSRKGPTYPFRFKDWSDYESATNEAIGTGDGATATVQLIKTYSDGVRTYVRTIQLPVNGALTVKVATVLKTETTHYTVNYSTGVITFTGGNIPTGGQAITATFEFDVPVRFADEVLRVSMVHATDDDGIGEIPTINLIEVLDE